MLFGQEGQRASFQGVNLAGIFLSGVNLHAAKLNATVFGVVETRGAVGDMSGCSMPTNLTRADYSDPGNTSVDLGDAVLSYTNVASAIMDRY